MIKENNDQIEMPIPEINGEGFVSHEPIEYSAGAPKSPMDILSEELEKGALDPTSVLDQNDQSEEGANAKGSGNVLKFSTRTNYNGLVEAQALPEAVEVQEVLSHDQPPPTATTGPESSVKAHGDSVESQTVEVDYPDRDKSTVNITNNPLPTKPQKSPFDPNTTQPALTNSEKEGGVALNRTTGPLMTSKLSSEGEIIKISSNIGPIQTFGKYEVGGFTVTYDLKKGVSKSTSIRDHFHDLETAMASVNVDKYLMPIEGGYKLSTITSGMPTISFNERLVYVYKNGKWSHI